MKRKRFLLLLLPLLAILAGCATNPVTGQSQLALMSEAQEIELGEQTFPVYTQAFFGVFQDSDVLDYVQAIGAKVAANTRRTNLNYQFRVLNYSEVNAFALPGGKICITRGLMNRLTSEAQLAGVLGHELVHVDARHHVQSYSRNLLTSVLVGVGQIYLGVRGVRGAEFLGKAGEITAGMVLAGYSRDQERQADDVGLGYLVKSGYEPREFVEVLKMLLSLQEKEPDRVERLFASHPLTSERIATCRARAEQLRATGGPLAVNPEPFARATRKIAATAIAYKFFDQGNEYTAEEKWNWAVSRFDEGVQAAPDQAIIHLGRAEAYLATNQLAEAERDILAAKRLYPDLFYTQYFAGMLSFKQRRWAQSLAELQAADQLLPGYPDTQFFMGRNHEEMGDRRAAAQCFVTYLKQVNQGAQAQYAYNRLVEWGYIQPARTR